MGIALMEFMTRLTCYGSTMVSLLVFVILGMPWKGYGEAPYGSAHLYKNVASRIHSVGIKSTQHETTVTVSWKGNVPDYSSSCQDPPPRIMIDLMCEATPFESKTLGAESPDLKGIRIGYHPDRIRLVLVLKGSPVPHFTTTTQKNSLVISMGSGKEKQDKEENPRSLPVVADGSTQNPKATSLLPHPLNTLKPDGATTLPEGAPQLNKRIPFVEKLLEVDADDGQVDTQVLMQGIGAFKAEDWSGASDALEYLIKKHGTSRHVERAYFLLADSSEHLYASRTGEKYREVKGRYEEALGRFPKSVHAPAALLAMGRLSLKLGDYEGALGHFNLILSSEKDSPVALAALMNKAKILSLQNKPQDALPILESLAEKCSGTREASEENVSFKIEVQPTVILTYGQDVLEAQRQEMKRDKSVFIMGEDVGLYGGAFAA